MESEIRNRVSRANRAMCQVLWRVALALSQRFRNITRNGVAGGDYIGTG